MAKDMYQKRKERQNKEQVIDNKTNINWYIPTLINFHAIPYFTRVFI